MLKTTDKATEFLKTAKLYHLGELLTEARHPDTMHLSEWAESDLPRAFAALTKVDIEALKKIADKIPEILSLRSAIQDTLKHKGKIFLCGCGATGRLSLTLERLWREALPGDQSVRAFMAGGDVALVHSLEGFEDFPEYGARHLRELGFAANDLLISCTEGGETPYVIGATEEAQKISTRKPFFLYCNPDHILKARVERSRRVIENANINKINLTVGPMALSGSTRMQASTALQLAVGYALLTNYSDREIRASLEQISQVLLSSSELLLSPLTQKESEIYKENAYLLYVVKDYAITVFTDTTERAPTFSLTSFSHKNAGALLARPPSLSYVSLPEAENSTAAWELLLGRAPHSLNWTNIDERTRSNYLLDFDFGLKAREFRRWLLKGSEQFDFYIQRGHHTIDFSLMDISRSIELEDSWTKLEEHTLLKLLMNQHSTLVMGRLGRYKNNVMTWVHPTNGKLIDRATRYARLLLQDEGVEVSYEDTVREVFNQFDKMSSNESVVLNTVKAFLK